MSNEQNPQTLNEPGVGLNSSLGLSSGESFGEQHGAANPQDTVDQNSVSLPEGVVYSVEKSQPHKEFVRATEPDWILLPIDHTRRLVAQDETAESWTPDGTQVVTSSAVHDDLLAEISIEEEVEIVNAFQPDAHVGGDVPVYDEWKGYRRMKAIRRLVLNAGWLQAQIDERVTIIPLIKGCTQQERALVYKALDIFDHNCIAFYAAQHFLGGNGVQLEDVIDEISTIATETATGEYQLSKAVGQGSENANADQIGTEAKMGQSATSTVETPVGGMSSGRIKSDASEWGVTVGTDESQGSNFTTPPAGEQSPTVGEQSGSGSDVFVIGCVSTQLGNIDHGVRAAAGLNVWQSRVTHDSTGDATVTYQQAVKAIEDEYAAVFRC